MCEELRNGRVLTGKKMQTSDKITKEKRKTDGILL